MIKIEDKSKCTGCFACASICPKNCITMERDEEGFLYPRVQNGCVSCGLCTKACPLITPKKEKNQIGRAIGAINKDEKIRLQSSSGGIFTLIAEKIIDNGGVVFGASFDGNFSVSHRAVFTKEDLGQFRGSKYTQSRIGNTYKEAKAYLEENRQVLFTGTPCQIGGLYAYLQKDYENLYTQDIICHGVPSPLVWESYLSFKEKEMGANVTEVGFRNKRFGWNRWSIKMSFDNKTEYIKTLGEDLFVRAFLKDLCLRPSCYNCAFKGKERLSDITLADFWGIKNVLPEMDDDKGTSLVIINSSKGNALFDSVSAQIEYKETDIDKALVYNPAAIKSAARVQNREKFMDAIKREGFGKEGCKYLKKPFLARVKSKIKRLIKR